MRMTPLVRRIYAYVWTRNIAAATY